MKKLNFLALTLLAMLTIGLTSCNKDHDEEIQGKYVEVTLDNGGSITICDSTASLSSDKIAGYPVYFQVILKDGNLIARGLTHKNCVRPLLTDRDCPTSAALINKGEFKGLSEVTGKANPTDTLAAAAEKNGYIVRAYGTMKFNANPSYMEHNIYDPDTVFMRVWLKEDKGNGSFVVRYQTDYLQKVE